MQQMAGIELLLAYLVVCALARNEMFEMDDAQRFRAYVVLT
jgi:hypothetical protein